MKIILGILVTAVALWFTTEVVPGIRIESSLTSFLIVAAVFGVVNALMLMLTAGLVGNAMSIEGEGIAKLGWAVVGSVVISIASILIGWILPDKD